MIVAPDRREKVFVSEKPRSSSNAYKALRQYVILPCDKTLKSYFGKLGSAGNSGKCNAVSQMCVSGHEGLEKCCYITADGIYVRVSVRYGANYRIMC